MSYIDFKGRKLTVQIPGEFEDGSECIELYEIDGCYARISFCAHDGVNVFPASAGCIWLKDWSENEDLAAFLIAEGYFEFTGKEIPSQYVTYKEAKATEKFKKLV